MKNTGNHKRDVANAITEMVMREFSFDTTRGSQNKQKKLQQDISDFFYSTKFEIANFQGERKGIYDISTTSPQNLQKLANLMVSELISTEEIIDDALNTQPIDPIIARKAHINKITTSKAVHSITSDNYEAKITRVKENVKDNVIAQLRQKHNRNPNPTWKEEQNTVIKSSLELSDYRKKAALFITKEALKEFTFHKNPNAQKKRHFLERDLALLLSDNLFHEQEIDIGKHYTQLHTDNGGNQLSVDFFNTMIETTKKHLRSSGLVYDKLSTLDPHSRHANSVQKLSLNPTDRYNIQFNTFKTDFITEIVTTIDPLSQLDEGAFPQPLRSTNPILNHHWSKKHGEGKRNDRISTYPESKGRSNELHTIKKEHHTEVSERKAAISVFVDRVFAPIHHAYLFHYGRGKDALLKYREHNGRLEYLKSNLTAKIDSLITEKDNPFIELLKECAQNRVANPHYNIFIAAFQNRLQVTTMGITPVITWNNVAGSIPEITSRTDINTQANFASQWKNFSTIRVPNIIKKYNDTYNTTLINNGVATPTLPNNSAGFQHPDIANFQNPPAYRPGQIRW